MGENHNAKEQDRNGAYPDLRLFPISAVIFFSDKYRNENTYPNFFCARVNVTKQLLVDTNNHCATPTVESHDFSKCEKCC